MGRLVGSFFTIFLLALLLIGIWPFLSENRAQPAQIQHSSLLKEKKNTIVSSFEQLLLAGGRESSRYVEDPSAFLNPERGFHGNCDILAETDLSWIREEGHTLARTYIRLDAYRNKQLPAAFLNKIADSLANARAAGIKIILRFSYNFGIGEADASLEQVLEHIEQLTPVLEEFQDVIVVLQAGFIGAWGEWHNSTNNLDTPENKREILHALLAALPVSRMVQLRYPDDLIDNYPIPPSRDDAYKESDIARTGHHNDCFLVNVTDEGTYDPEERLEEFKRYLEKSTLYTVTGGETCQVTPDEHRTDCQTALAEMKRFHWSYLNYDFYAPDVERWKREGCYDEISKRLGYRYRLQYITYQKRIAQNRVLNMECLLTNDGFANLYNRRPLEVILQNISSGKIYTLIVAEDVRKLLPNPGESRQISISLPIPLSVASGIYQLFLNLPDDDPQLSQLPEYSIRLANKGVWRAESGYNSLGILVSRHLSIDLWNPTALEQGSYKQD